MNQIISDTLSQAKAHKYDKEDICVSSGECMAANDNFTLEICCPKEKAADEDDIVNDIREMMDSLILNQLNQANEDDGEVLYGQK